MLTFYDPFFHLAAEKGINFVANLNEATSAAKELEPFIGPIVRQRVVNDKPGAPNGGCFESESAVVLLVGGVRDNPTRLALGNGWGDLAAIGAAHGFNPAAYGPARDWFYDLLPKEPTDKRPICLVGHSMGSMVCHVVNWMRGVNTGHFCHSVLTTGGPRSLSTLGNGQYGPGFYRRVMMYPDPFTLLPPRFSESPALNVIVAGLTFPVSPADLFRLTIGQDITPPPLVWNEFGHCPGGMIIDESGGWRFSESPPDPGLLGRQANDFGAAIAYCLDNTVHDINTYISAMELWAPEIHAVLWPEDTGPGEVSGGTWGDDTIVDRQALIPEAIPDAWLNVPPGTAFPVRDGFFVLPLTGVPFMGQPNPIVTGTMPDPTGGTFGTLYLRGELIAVFPNRSRARTAARHLNRFLSRLPIADEVSTSGLQAGIDAYLKDAAVGKGVDKKPVRVVS